MYERMKILDTGYRSEQKQIQSQLPLGLESDELILENNWFIFCKRNNNLHQTGASGIL